VKTIELTKGKVALVDDEDYPELSRYKWQAAQRDGRWYAVRTERRKGKKVGTYMHRQILKPPLVLKTDHVNGNGLDNRKDNLRTCTDQQNGGNQGVRKNNTSGFKGVCLCKRTKRWAAAITIAFRTIHLGYYATVAEAAQAYNAAAINYYGAFAWLNTFPVESVGCEWQEGETA
jgi:hypothetical protein